MKITQDQFEKIIKTPFETYGDRSLEFSGMQTVTDAEAGDITWIRPSVTQAEEFINSTKASAVICNRGTYERFKGDKDSKLFIISEDPKTIFVAFVKYIHASNSPAVESSIHPTAIVHKDCQLGKNVSIGAYAIIGACIIGDHTVIHEHVKIFDPVTIGSHCVVREFCSIGGAGFGYLKNEENVNEHIPHIGSVVIGNHVEIFPYSNVDRGTLGETRIADNTVIDHYVHIGHNTSTGKNNIIAAGCVLAGGSKIADNCFIGVHTVLKEKCSIGSHVITGMGSVVVKNIPDGEIWAGNPAKFLKPNS